MPTTSNFRLPGALELALAYNFGQKREGLLQGTFPEVVRRATVWNQRYFKNHEDLCSGLWEILHEQEKREIFYSLDPIRQRRILSQITTVSRRFLDVDTISPYRFEAIPEEERQDLGIPDASIENFTHFLKRLPNLVTLVELLVGDAAPRTVNEVGLEIQQSYERKTGVKIVTKRDIQTLLFENLSAEKRRIWRSLLPESLRAQLPEDRNPYGVPRNLQTTRDHFVTDLPLPSITPSGITDEFYVQYSGVSIMSVSEASMPSANNEESEYQQDLRRLVDLEGEADREHHSQVSSPRDENAQNNEELVETTDKDWLDHLPPHHTENEAAPEKNLLAMLPQDAEEPAVGTPPDTIRVGPALKDDDEPSLKDTTDGSDEDGDDDGDKSRSSAPKSRDGGATRKSKPPKKNPPVGDAKKPKAKKIKAEKKEEAPDRSVYSHRFDNILWQPGMPVAPSVEKGTKGTSVSQDSYNEWPLYNSYLDVTKDNVPPDNVRLCDWIIWKIVEAKISGSTRGTSWPADFNSDGAIRRERQPHGWPAKVTVTNDAGKAVWRYIVYKGYYLLCGDEGKSIGLQHVWSKSGVGKAQNLAVSSHDAVDQTFNGPKPSQVPPPKPAKQPPAKSKGITPSKSAETRLPRTASSPSEKAKTPVAKSPTDASVKAAAIRAAAARTIAAKTGSSVTLDAIRAATSAKGEEPTSWRAKLDREIQRTAEPEDTAKAEAANFRGAMKRGKQILDLTSKAMVKIIDADRTATENQTRLDEEIAAMEKQMANLERNLAVLRKRRTRIQAEESTRLLSIPAKLIDELTSLGYTKDGQEVSASIEDGYRKGLKRKHGE